MPKLILDVAGGDYAPDTNLEGALQALPEIEGELILVGDEPDLRRRLGQRRYRALAQALAETDGAPDGPQRCRVRIVHAPETIDMADSIRAVRSKPGASINVGCRMAAADWAAWKSSPQTAEPSAFISAGHSGAMMASALLNLGRLPGVERPAIAVKLPTLQPDGCVLLDVGANVDCKPEHLRDFAIMGAAFAQAERTAEGLPRIGVLSNGEEKSKGNELTRAASALIEKLPGLSDKPGSFGRFIGNVEGKEIFRGEVDVVVADGFVGNVVLKSLEGLGSAVVSQLKREAKGSIAASLGFLFTSGVLIRLKRKLDYAEYGAAPLLGVAGYAFICHGRSTPKAIKNSLLRTQTALRSRFVERLETALASADGA